MEKGIENSSTQKSSEEEIDLIALLAQVWNGRNLIIKLTSFFFILGLVYVLLTPDTYEARSVFVPQQHKGGSSRSLGGLASLAGINLAGSDENGISPVLYPKVIYSNPFKAAMLNAELMFNDKHITYRDYLKQKPTPILGYLKKYTIGLPRVIINSLKSNDSEQTDMEIQDSLKIDNEEYLLMKSLEGVISLEIDDREGYITLRVRDTEPNIAAQLTIWVQENLQQKVISFKQQSTKELYDYVSEQFLKKQEELYQLQDSLARFKDQNQNINSAYVVNRRLRLEANVSMLTSVYSELASQKEQTALQLKKEMPIFAVIDPVKEPNSKKGPKRAMTLMITILLGLLISTSYVLFRKLFEGVVSKIKVESKVNR